ncbi:aspartate kinase [Aurantibacillus circumpalustris]|uniref:aspartate kinase n=1 Tax=Aurantibacillus circumpalustris TaxID=3036359 RepID=UPI00295A7E78|nr:aspartate kinase [Aurantibacillus circumpalustris]
MFLVLKFGGTSVGSAQRIKDLVKFCVTPAPKIVVLSAMSGTTNALVEICEALYAKEIEKATTLISILKLKYDKEIKDLYSKPKSIEKAEQLITNHFNHLLSFTMDMFTVNEEKAILAQGELLSTALFHYYLEECGFDSALLPALNFMKIDANDEPDMAYIEKFALEELKKHPEQKLFITQGYICRNVFGEIDNLKRGGSDYTASIIGAAIKSTEVQIWTDIDGMHNNDPRIVDKTHPIKELSFDEAAELAYFGAKILHPTCILPAKKRNIPVRLKNTLQPEALGTLIANINTNEGIKAVAAKDGITAINIKSDRMLLAHGFLRAVFEIFERYKTPIDMICTSEVAVSLTIDNNKNLGGITKELKEIAMVEIDDNQTIICIVGQLPKDKSGYANKVLDALKDIPLRMVSYGGSANNISVLVNGSLKKEALQALNKGLFNY